MPPKTVIEKSQSPSSDVTVFKVAGTLGFHEKTTLEKLIGECKKRGLTRVVLDMSELRSLGGGCAQILRDEARGGGIALGIAGAKTTALRFLNKDPVDEIAVTETVAQAVEQLLGVTAPAATETGVEELTDDELVADEMLEEVLADDPAEQEEAEAAAEENADAAVAAEPAPEPEANPKHKSPEKKKSADSTAPAAGGTAAPRELQKRIVQYNTIFSLNSDFSQVEDRKSLLDLLLLTTIAQVGVESAVFLEYSQGYFVPAAMKGIQAEEVRGFALDATQFRLEEWQRDLKIHAIDEAPFKDDVKAPLLSLGCAHVAPFVVHGTFRGIILLGRPLKKDLDESTMEFLRMLINQAALAYGSMTKVEEETERTLGLVQTLIALIEENTLARGNTNLISNFVYGLAERVHYPEEHVRDLMYGTVLRDIGMIKVSDLIVRSPRELMPEEWEIIKRHPIDGADMLRRMRFSEHAVGVVRSHHERFNGEGYPDGIQGQEIPMGARIVSVVESYAAMLQERPTRPALTGEEALNTLRENWGMRYDPEAVGPFTEMVEVQLRTGETTANRKFELFSV
jgi:HD-GYP domain-containing protein (c-di-GMP phosphodiesterase class II)